MRQTNTSNIGLHVGRGTIEVKSTSTFWRDLAITWAYGAIGVLFWYVFLMIASA